MPIPDAANLQFCFQSNAGLFTDLAGSTPATTGGALVAAWQDQSGNLNHAAQATSGNRPSLQLNQVNGLPSVRFDGSSSWLQFVNVFAAPKMTLYALLKTSNSGGANTILCGNTASLQWRIETNFKQRLVDAATADIGTAGAALSSGVWSQVNVSWDGQNGIFRTNKAADTTVTSGSNTAFAPFRRIGVNLAGSATEWFGGDLACLLGYSTLHDTTTRQAVEAYITSIFG